MTALISSRKSGIYRKQKQNAERPSISAGVGSSSLALNSQKIGVYAQKDLSSHILYIKKVELFFKVLCLVSVKQTLTKVLTTRFVVSKETSFNHAIISLHNILLSSNKFNCKHNLNGVY